MFASARRISAFLLLSALPLMAADQNHNKKNAVPPAAAPADRDQGPWDDAQPAVEKIDYTMYARIREEGLLHSHVMEYGSALADDIGPRLTGSPNMAKANPWTRDQLTAMGCENAHLEDWGEFGMGWQQLNTWVRMTSPDTAVFIAQATPWSPGTNGPVSGDAVNVNITDDKDFDQYKGKLAGKIVFLGEMREVPPVDKALFERYSDKELEDIAEYPTGNASGPDYQARLKAYMARYRMAD